MLTVIRRNPGSIPGNREPKPDFMPPLARSALVLYKIYSPEVDDPIAAARDRAGRRNYSINTIRDMLPNALYDLKARKQQSKRLDVMARMLAGSCHKSAEEVGKRVARAFDNYVDLRETVRDICAQPGIPITPRNIYNELLYVERDFPELVVHAPHRYIEVTTEQVILEGVDLGAFKIRVPFDGLTAGLLNTVRVNGVEPSKAAAGSEQYAHPHVKNGNVCWGEGTNPAAKALREARFSDFFLIVWALLNTYNDSSPYLAISTWKARRRKRCTNCNAAIGDEQILDCGRCQSSYCRECSVRPQPCAAPDCTTDNCGNCRSRCSKCSKECCRNCVRKQRDMFNSRLCVECGTQCSDCGYAFPRAENVAIWAKNQYCRVCADERKQQAEREATRKAENERKRAAAAALRQQAEAASQAAAQRTAVIAESPENLTMINRIRADLGLPPLTVPAPGAQPAAVASPVITRETATTLEEYLSITGVLCGCHLCLSPDRLDLCECDDCRPDDD